MSSSTLSVSASVPMPVISLSAGGAEVSDVAQFLTMLQAATPEQAADILSVLDRGLPLWSSRKEASEAAESVAATPVKAKKEKAVKAPGAPKKEKPVKVVAALPEAAEGAPDASDYRVEASSIDEALCIGRNLKGGEDKRWKPIIYRESQCGGKRVEGSDLCTKCSKREEKCAENPAKPGDWNGRITEEPEAWVHMLGTTWAEEKGCKFVGGSVSSAGSVVEADAADAASENGSAEEMPAAAAAAAKPVKAAVADKKAEKEAAAAAKAAEKAAAAAAAKAAKEAEKEAAKAAKAAEKEAAKAAKAAEKEAEKLAKAAAKPAAAPKAAAKPKAAKPEAKKAAVAEPVAVAGELKLIDGSLYMVKNGNVFEYDELAEKAGDFVGRLTGDETIDTEADEVTTEESDSD